MPVFTSYREKLRKEKHQEDIPDSHSCICAHCGRRFSEENDNTCSDISVDTDPAESEDRDNS